MCLAVPVQVTAPAGESLVRCRVGEGETYLTASTLLLEDDVQIGDYLIVHAGFALRKLDPADAAETLSLMREMLELAENSPTTEL